MNHTPLPWTFEKENNAHQYIKTPFYIRAGDYLIAVGGLQAENTMGNARLIVQACNSHAELLEASVYALQVMDDAWGDCGCTPSSPDMEGMICPNCALREAIRKARRSA